MIDETQCIPQSLFGVDYTKNGTVVCSDYQDHFSNECTLFDKKDNPKARDECLGCFLDHYCKYIAKMFQVNPATEWYL